jgi:hypothetical protein
MEADKSETSAYQETTGLNTGDQKVSVHLTITVQKTRKNALY